MEKTKKLISGKKDMDQNVISVIVPVYNTERYIKTCLESIRDQTWKSLEVWMVDDGSTDGSGRICDEFAETDQRFHVIHQMNSGVSSARNQGIQHAKGQFVCFVDSDDWLEPDYLMQLEAAWDQSITLSMCCYSMNDDQPCWPCGQKEAETFRDAAAQAFIISDKMSGPCNKLFLLSEIHERSLCFDSEITIGEDMLFVYEYLAGGSMRFVPVALYHYRQSDNSLSRSDFKPSRMDLFTVLKRMEEHQSSPEVLKAIRQKRAYSSMVSLLLLMTSEKKPREEKHLIRTLRNYLRQEIGVFMNAQDYTLSDKLGALMMAVSPKMGEKLYRLLYMRRIQGRTGSNEGLV